MPTRCGPNRAHVGTAKLNRDCYMLQGVVLVPPVMFPLLRQQETLPTWANRPTYSHNQHVTGSGGLAPTQGNSTRHNHELKIIALITMIYSTIGFWMSRFGAKCVLHTGWLPTARGLPQSFEAKSNQHIGACNTLHAVTRTSPT